MTSITSDFIAGNILSAAELNEWKNKRTGNIEPYYPPGVANQYQPADNVYKLGTTSNRWSELNVFDINGLGEAKIGWESGSFLHIGPDTGDSNWAKIALHDTSTGRFSRYFCGLAENVSSGVFSICNSDDADTVIQFGTGSKKLYFTSVSWSGSARVESTVGTIDSSGNMSLIGDLEAEAVTFNSSVSIITGPGSFLQVGLDTSDGNRAKVSFHPTHTMTTDRYFGGIVSDISSGDFFIANSDTGNTHVQFGTGTKKLLFDSISWSGSARVSTNVGSIDASGNLAVTGNITASGDVYADNITASGNLEAEAGTFNSSVSIIDGPGSFLQVGLDTSDGNRAKVSFHPTHTMTTDRYFGGIVNNISSGDFFIANSDTGNTHIQFGTGTKTLSFNSISWSGSARVSTNVGSIDASGNLAVTGTITATTGNFSGDVSGSLATFATQYYCTAYSTTTFGGASGASNTSVTFDTEFQDSGSIHSTSSDTSRFIAPKTGTYRFEVTASFGLIYDGNAANSTFIFRKNGTTTLSTQQIFISRQTVRFSYIATLAEDDYLEFVLYALSSGQSMYSATAEFIRIG